MLLLHLIMPCWHCFEYRSDNYLIFSAKYAYMCALLFGSSRCHLSAVRIFLLHGILQESRGLWIILLVYQNRRPGRRVHLHDDRVSNDQINPCHAKLTLKALYYFMKTMETKGFSSICTQHKNLS